MDNVVIIGSSASGHSLAQRLREKNKNCSITLVAQEGYACYDRRKLLDYFAGSVREKDLFLDPADYYQRENIVLRRGAKAVGINCDRRTVYLKLEDKRDSIPFDFLAVCSGMEVVPPEVPGIRKEGVFTFNDLSDVKAAKSVVINGPVCLLGDWNANARAFVSCLLAMKKEIVLITPSATGDIPEGITVINSAISEFIGESGLQAVKLREGKIIGTTFCVLTGPLRPAAGFLDDTGIAREDGFISVDGGFRTSRQDVFACGSVTGKCGSWEEAARQAALLADILGDLLK